MNCEGQRVLWRDDGSSFRTIQIVLESVWVLNKQQDWIQTLSKDKPVRIPADPLVVRFDYSSPDLCSGEGRIKFQTRLLPKEELWTNEATNLDVTCRFWSPGKYRLEIEADGDADSIGP